MYLCTSSFLRFLPSFILSCLPSLLGSLGFFFAIYSRTKRDKDQMACGICSSMVYVFRVKIMMSSLSDVEFLFTSSPNPLVPSSTSSAQSSASISSPSQILILAPSRCCSPLQSSPYMKDKYLMALVKLNTQYCKRKCCSIQGGRSWRAFGERKITPQSFRRARICTFSRQKRRFLQLRNNWYFLL